MPVVRLDPRAPLTWLRARARTGGPVGRTIPILPSSDLDRTAEFYRSAGMQEVARYEGYLLMEFRGVEVHFTSEPGAAGAGQAFVLVPDAGRLWKQLKSQGAPGLGPVEDREHGLREFVVTDPDGNRIRVGSPPKAYLGDPCYDVLQHLINCEERLAADPAGLAQRMTDLLDLDGDRVRLCLFARCAIEGVEDPMLQTVAAALTPA